MKAAMLDARPVAPASSAPLDQRLARFLNDDFRPVRQLIRRAPDRDIEFILTTNYEACAGWECLGPVARDFTVPEHVLHRHLFSAGLHRIKANPTGYLRLNIQDYAKLWLLHPRKDPAIAKRYNEFLAREEEPLPFSRELGELGRPVPEGQQRLLYSFNRLIFAGMGVLALLLPLLLMVYRPGPLASISLVSLVGMQAALIAGSFVGTGLPRYPMGFWPILIGGLFSGLYALAIAGPLRFAVHKRR
jgi:hypothetical protein